MSKLYQKTLALVLTLPLLTGCGSKMQEPNKGQTITPPNTYGSQFQPPGSDTAITSSIPGGGINDNPSTRGGDLPGNFDPNNPPADMILVSVHFEYDSFNILSTDRPLLEAAAKALAADPTAHVVAVGHCDWHGSDQYNLALGEKRSNSVKSYLTQKGSGAAAIEILSMGEYGATPDVAKNSPEAKHDRRVDVVKIPAGATLPSGPPASTEPVAATPATAP